MANDAGKGDSRRGTDAASMKRYRDNWELIYGQSARKTVLRNKKTKRKNN